MRACVYLVFALLCFPIEQFVFAQCDRETMVQDYQKYMMGTSVTLQELDWTGDAEKCQPGITSNMAIERTMARINYFRTLAGVHSKLQYDTSLEHMCQQAALMMHSQNDLSHDPPDSWACYSQDGKQAAGRSNLALGAHSVNAISLYMRDPGASNFAVGHRRWILFSRGKDIGLGSTSRAQVMYVIHNRTEAPEDLEYIPYPGEGFFPASLVPDRWSLGYPKADFSETDVVMADQDGDLIPLEILELKRGFGDNTIVWEPDAGYIDKYSGIDLNYSVYVKNIYVNDDTIDVSYQVTIAPSSYPPICAEGLEWDELNCSCTSLQTTNLRELDKSSPLKIYPNPVRSFVTFEVPSNYFQNGEPAQIQISNTAGRLMRQIQVKDPISHHDLSGLSDGIYFCRFVNGQHNSSQVLVKGH